MTNWDHFNVVPFRQRQMTEQPMPKEFRKGDRVEWDTSQGATQGEVVRKQTSSTQIKGHNVKASKENPQYIVESDKSGKRAAHKPDELRRKR